MSAKQWAKLQQLNVDIADMTSTVVRVGEANNWSGELYEAIEANLARWRKERDALLGLTQE
jgi:hypothetical protein